MGRRLALVALGPVLWFAHLSVLYALVPPACRAGSALAFHAATAAVLAGLLAGGLWAHRRWTAGALTTVVVTSLGYFSLVVLVTGLVPVVVRTCA